ncbi:MAG TPA: hypothetical protein VIN58_20980 [Roseateles sp.]
MDSFLTVRKHSGRLGRATVAGLLTLLAVPQALAQVPATLPGAAQGKVQELREFKEESRRVSEYDRLHGEAMAAKKKQREGLAKDQSALTQSRQLLDSLLELPATLKLSAEGRVQAETVLKPHRERVAAAWPALEQQAVAANTDMTRKRKSERQVDYEQAALELSARALNEAALWFADAEPQASDAIWIEALRRGGLCEGVTDTDPAALMATLIDALPAEQRQAAWAGEAARLSRWGQETRTVLPAPQRALEDSLVPALAPAARAKTLASMPETLRAAVQAPDWKLEAQAPAQRCELLRWWSQEQVRAKRLSAQQALLAWRTALAPRSADFLLTALPRSGAEAIDKGGYPAVARRLGLTGRVVVEQDVDATGKPAHLFIQRRELRAASLGNQPPLALEHELDRVTLDRVESSPRTAPAAGTLQAGVATQRMGIEWATQ